MKQVLILPVICILALLVSCQNADNTEAVQNESAPPSAAVVLPVLLPKADEKSAYFLWKPEEQLVGYRNIDKIFSTRMVKASATPRTLTKATNSLSVSFEFNDEQFTEDTFMESNNVVGLLVIKDDEIVLEKYRQDYGPEQRWISFSVAKSFTTTLVGAAIKDGAIKSLQDPLTDYLPKLAGSSYDGVTVQQLLTMTTGVAWNEDYADPNSDVAKIKAEPSVDGSDPIVSYLSRMPRRTDPGTEFSYNTGETHLVGSLLYAATGKYLADYLSEKIWQPYGMEHDANWMLTKGGTEQAGCCLSATLRDFGRFGQFFMRGAKIDGVSIVPDNWVTMATTSSDVSRDAPMMRQRRIDGYGFMWWTVEGPAYQAVGIFGQLIYINPELNLIVVTQSAWPAALSGMNLSEAFAAAVETTVSQ
jgi:CubicO group peptidase (beta-lactamase class C family)